MNTIQFPKMIQKNKINIITDPHTATSQNVISLLNCTKMEQFGDPYFGINLERFRFRQNNQMLQDVVADDLYIALRTYIPQLRLTRKNIKITQQQNQLTTKIEALNVIDMTPNIFESPLLLGFQN